MQSSFASNKVPHEESLPDILMRIVAELHDVAYLIERIEPSISDNHAGQPLGVAEKLMVMQGIDLAVQKTRGLAEFIDTIASGIPEEHLVDVATALNLVKLADMQKALSGAGLRQGHSQPLNRAAGDFDLF
jgi:hypothetical protein